MSNEIVAPTEPLAETDRPSADARPVLEMVAADDALLCVDDACLPPELRVRDAEAASPAEGIDR